MKTVRNPLSYFEERNAKWCRYQLCTRMWYVESSMSSIWLALAICDAP